MRSGSIPFKFDVGDLLARARRLANNHLGDVKITLPFLTIGVSPASREKKIASELVIWLKDRRVLSAWECCDDCIDKSLASLREIRKTLVEKQLQLTELQDGALYLLLDAMATGIRQFMTFEELLNRDTGAPPHPRFPDFHRPPDTRQTYFDALEVLRGHLSRCLAQIAAIAGMPVPTQGLITNYQGPWLLEAYQEPVETDS
jgi:hypothetical protein